MPGSIHILIAEDEEIFQSQLVEMFRREGYECEGASDVPSALEKLRAREYDLLLTDLLMRGGSGLDLVKFLRGQDSATAVIILTAHPTVQTAVEALNKAVAAYLIKPVRLAELLDCARRALEKRVSLRVARNGLKRLESWKSDLQQIEEALQAAPLEASGAPVTTLLNVTLQNIMGSLLDLRSFIQAAGAGPGEEAAKAMAGSRPLILLEALRETILTLEKTKSSFKSRELADLRHKLEALLGEARPKPGRDAL